MNFSKKIARTIIFPAIVSFRGEKLIRTLSQNSILNIMFHGVVERNSLFFSQRHIQYDIFEKYLKYFTNNFEIISLNEAFQYYISGTKLPKKTITISFDDGYRNNLTCALPLIEKYKVPVTFFISGICADNFNGRQAIWADKLLALNFFSNNKVIEILNYKFINFFDKINKENIFDFVKSQNKEKRDNILLELNSKYNIDDLILNVPNEIWSLLSPQNIIDLCSSKYVDIGSHGYSHYNLANIYLSDAIEDLENSKLKLEKLISKKINLLAYPDGNYNLEIINIANNLGFNNQLCVNYLNIKDKSDLRLLNRIGVSSTTTFESNIYNLNMLFHSKGYN